MIFQSNVRIPCGFCMGIYILVVFELYLWAKSMVQKYWLAHIVKSCMLYTIHFLTGRGSRGDYSYIRPICIIALNRPGTRDNNAIQLNWIKLDRNRQTELSHLVSWLILTLDYSLLRDTVLCLLLTANTLLRSRCGVTIGDNFIRQIPPQPPR